MVNPLAPQARANAAKSIGCNSQPYSGLPGRPLLPFDLRKELFLMTTTLIGNPYFTAVTNSPSASRIRRRRRTRRTADPDTRVARRSCKGGRCSHTRQSAGNRIHLTAAGGNVPGPPGRDRAGIARDNCVLGDSFAELPSHHLRFHRMVRSGARSSISSRHCHRLRRFVKKLRSLRRWSRGKSACNVSPASPTRPTSTGNRKPIRSGSMSS